MYVCEKLWYRKISILFKTFHTVYFKQHDTLIHFSYHLHLIKVRMRIDTKFGITFLNDKRAINCDKPEVMIIIANHLISKVNRWAVVIDTFHAKRQRSSTSGMNRNRRGEMHVKRFSASRVTNIRSYIVQAEWKDSLAHTFTLQPSDVTHKRYSSFPLLRAVGLLRGTQKYGAKTSLCACR